MIALYRKLFEKFNWTVHEIDETNLESLMDFLFYKERSSDTMTIGGKTYHRVPKGKVPSWL